MAVVEDVLAGVVLFGLLFVLDERRNVARLTPARVVVRRLGSRDAELVGEFLVDLGCIVVDGGHVVSERVVLKV